MIIRLCVMVFVGAWIGWITNWLAIKMLFHPYERKGFLCFHVQGLIPKRRDQLAAGISEVVEQELISLQEVMDKVDLEEGFQKLQLILDKHLDENLEKEIRRIFPFAAMFLSREHVEKVKGFIEELLIEKRGEIQEVLMTSLEDKVDFRAMMEEKLSSFSLEKMEDLIRSLAKKELQHIEWIGAVLGAILGGVQFLLFSYFM